jgi:putative hydrolase of the HAD superfamily
VIDAVILDLGNVLAFHDNARLFRELAALYRTTEARLRERLEGTGTWERANRGHLKGDLLRLELNRRLGAEPSPHDFVRVWSCHFTLNTPMIHQVERLVGKARLVLLSNTHDLHVAHLRPQLPVLERFEGLVLSCEVGLIKPEPEIYARAIALAGVPPQRAVFFDDMEPYVEGARRAGLHAHVFRDAAEVPGQLAALGLPHLLHRD